MKNENTIKAVVKNASVKTNFNTLDKSSMKYIKGGILIDFDDTGGLL